MTDPANSIKTLHRSIRACRICVDNLKGNPLPHEPNPVAVLSDTARIAICGQAPGNKVNISGVPFTDPSGDRLRDWLGVDEATFYDASKFAIVPMGFCFPGYDKNGGDLPPRSECRLNWHDRVFAAMPQLELKILVGASAHRYHLKDMALKTVTETVVHWQDILEKTGSLPMPHPSWRNTAWIRKNPWFEKDLLPVLRESIQEKLP